MLLSTTQGRVCVYKSVENATPVSVLFFFFANSCVACIRIIQLPGHLPQMNLKQIDLCQGKLDNDGCSLPPGNMEKREPNIHETIP